MDRQCVCDRNHVADDQWIASAVRDVARTERAVVSEKIGPLFGARTPILERADGSTAVCCAPDWSTKLVCWSLRSRMAGSEVSHCSMSATRAAMRLRTGCAHFPRATCRRRAVAPMRRPSDVRIRLPKSRRGCGGSNSSPCQIASSRTLLKTCARQSGTHRAVVGRHRVVHGSRRPEFALHAFDRRRLRLSVDCAISKPARRTIESISLR